MADHDDGGPAFTRRKKPAHKAPQPVEAWMVADQYGNFKGMVDSGNFKIGPSATPYVFVSPEKKLPPILVYGDQYLIRVTITPKREREGRR